MKSPILFALAVAALASWAPDEVSAQITVESEVAEAIVDRMPQNPGTSFAADVGSVSCWSMVTGGEGASIQHVWMHDDLEFPVTLQIGGSPWRTWSSKTIPPEWAGEWSVEIRDGDGNVLETLAFTVGA